MSVAVGGGTGMIVVNAVMGIAVAGIVVFKSREP